MLLQLKGVNPFVAFSLTSLLSCRSELLAKVQTLFNNQHYSQDLFHIRCCGPFECMPPTVYDCRCPCAVFRHGRKDDAFQLLLACLACWNGHLIRIPVDTRSPIPVISVQSVGDLQYRWQSKYFPDFITILSHQIAQNENQ